MYIKLSVYISYKHIKGIYSCNVINRLVKAATLIFISERGSAISSAKQGKSGSIDNFVVVWVAQTCVHYMKILTVYTLNSHLLTLKAHNYKMYVFVVH